MQSHADYSSVDTGFDALDYAYAPSGARTGNPHIHGERELWCAVIAQAFFDMGAMSVPVPGRNKTHSPARSLACDEAARWLLHNTVSFTRVCDMAGVNPHVIRRAAQIFYARIPAPEAS